MFKIKFKQSKFTCTLRKNLWSAFSIPQLEEEKDLVPFTLQEKLLIARQSMDMFRTEETLGTDN